MRTRRLSEFKGKTVVLEWTSASCPFVRAQYESGVMPELQKMGRAQGIAASIISTHPSRRDYLAAGQGRRAPPARGAGARGAADGFSRRRMGRAYGAVVTPQMFVIDPKGEIVYRARSRTTPR